MSTFIKVEGSAILNHTKIGGTPSNTGWNGSSYLINNVQTTLNIDGSGIWNNQVYLNGSLATNQRVVIIETSNLNADTANISYYDGGANGNDRPSTVSVTLDNYAYVGDDAYGVPIYNEDRTEYNLVSVGELSASSATQNGPQIYTSTKDSQQAITYTNNAGQQQQISIRDLIYTAEHGAYSLNVNAQNYSNSIIFSNYGNPKPKTYALNDVYVVIQKI